MIVFEQLLRSMAACFFYLVWFDLFVISIGFLVQKKVWEKWFRVFKTIVIMYKTINQWYQYKKRSSHDSKLTFSILTVGSSVMITWSSRPWYSISPSNLTKPCFLARNNSPTTLLEITLYNSKSSLNPITTSLFGESSLTVPCRLMISTSSEISFAKCCAACLPLNSVLLPSTGLP